MHKNFSLVVIVIHRRWWRLVVVVMTVGIATRDSEHCHACQKEGSESFLDRHSERSILEFRFLLRHKMPFGLGA